MKIWRKIGFLLQLIALMVCFYWSFVSEEEKLFVIRLCTVFLGILLATNVFVYIYSKETGEIMKKIIALFKRHPFLFLLVNMPIVSFMFYFVQMEPWLEWVMVFLFSFVIYAIETNVVSYLSEGKIKIRTIEQIIDEEWKKHREEKQREMGTNMTIRDCKK